MATAWPCTLGHAQQTFRSFLRNPSRTRRLPNPEDVVVLNPRRGLRRGQVLALAHNAEHFDDKGYVLLAVNPLALEVGKRIQQLLLDWRQKDLGFLVAFETKWRRRFHSGQILDVIAQFEATQPAQGSRTKVSSQLAARYRRVIGEWELPQ